MNFHPLFIGTPEVIVIVLIVVIFFGADKIPELARGLAKGIRQIKDATNDIKQQINKTAEEQEIDTGLVKDIKKEISQVKDNIDDFTGSIKRNS